MPKVIMVLSIACISATFGCGEESAYEPLTVAELSGNWDVIAIPYDVTLIALTEDTLAGMLVLHDGTDATIGYMTIDGHTMNWDQFNPFTYSNYEFELLGDSRSHVPVKDSIIWFCMLDVNDELNIIEGDLQSTNFGQRALPGLFYRGWNRVFHLQGTKRK